MWIYHVRNKIYTVIFNYDDTVITDVMGRESEVEKHLAEGKRLLQEGQLSDALYHYAAAVGQFLLYTLIMK